ncbi:MAG: hypothetical protein M3Y54_04235, partial [Bacteroidota bacterium]|nr:hypothetical protein [Bacteroidota bacterium]
APLRPRRPGYIGKSYRWSGLFARLEAVRTAGVGEGSWPAVAGNPGAVASLGTSNYWWALQMSADASLSTFSFRTVAVHFIKYYLTYCYSKY